MQKLIKVVFLALFPAVLLMGCGENEEKKSEQEATQTESNDAADAEEAQVSEEVLRAFLHSKEGTYGWNTTSDELGLDFFKDGRLHVQGPDGEATMWLGTWSLQGNQLTMQCEECGSMPSKQTFPIKIDGEKLLIGDKVYTRYAPE